MKERQTKHEKNLIACGYEIITWEHEEIVDYLLQVFKRDYDHLLLLAAADNTKRRTLSFVLDYDGMGSPLKINIGGTVIYDKRKRKFIYIQYSDRYGWGVQFSITSRAAFFCRDFYNQIKHVFPFGHSQKKLTAYLTSNYDYLMSTI